MPFTWFIPRRHVTPRRQVLSRVVGQILQDALAQLRAPTTTSPNEVLRRACRTALEHLWDRRDALARSLLSRHDPCATAPVVLPRRALVHFLHDHRIVELDDAVALCTRTLDSALQTAALPQAAADRPHPQRWPFSPQHWAMSLRRIVERASPVHEVRLELMKLGTRVLCPHVVDAWHQATRVADARPSVDTRGEPNLTTKISDMQYPMLPLRSDRAGGWPPVRRRFRDITWLYLSVCLVALLVGCGGGSGTPSPAGPPAPVAIPGAASAVTVTAGDNETTLGWGAVRGATSYTIYRSMPVRPNATAST